MWTWRACWTGNTPFNVDFCFASSKSGKEHQNSPWSVLQSQERCNGNYFRLATILGLKLFLKTTQYQRLKNATKQTWVEQLSRMLFICQYGNMCKTRSHILVFFVHSTHQWKGHHLFLIRGGSENQSFSVSLEETNYGNTTAAGLSTQ